MLDSHCHIDLYKNPLAVATEAEMRSIDVVAVTYLPSHYEMAKRHLREFKYVRPALGLHPLAWKDHHKELGKFSELARKANWIGEIGLDFSNQGRPGRDIQERSFVSVLECLAGQQRFITLHSRGAEAEVLAQLDRHGIEKATFHWFSGSKTQLRKVVESGHLISINTAMIKTEKWAQFISAVPRSQILTETDGPFVTRVKKPETPACVSDVIEWLSRTWDCSTDLVEAQIHKNFLQFLPAA